MNPSRDPFLSRLFWVSVAAGALLFLWRAFPSIEQQILGVGAAPRVVTPLFEKAKGSVVYITTRERVLDLSRVKEALRTAAWRRYLSETIAGDTESRSLIRRFLSQGNE